MRSQRAPRRAVTLAAVAALNAVAAFGGALGLATGLLDLGDTYEHRLPFDSPVLAGLALAIVVAVPSTMLAVSAWYDDRRPPHLALWTGVALLGWIVVQVVVLQTLSVLQLLYVAVGVYFVRASGRVHLSRRATGVLLVLSGSVAVAIGIGLGPQLIENFPSVPAVVAAIAVIGGLYTVVRGVRAAASDRRRPGQIMTGLGALVIVAVVAWLVAPAVAVNNVPPSDITSTPEDLGLDADDVTLTTDDGVALAAWYVAGSSDAAVVVLHGAGSTRSNALDEAEVLNRNGFGVLLVDARGHGESEGTAMDFGWYGDLDIRAGTDYLASRPEVSRIGLLGLSMGGEEAIGAAADDRRISAVVAEGATARTADDKEWLSDAYGWRGWVQEQFEYVQYGLADLLTEASAPTPLATSIARATSTSFLLITASTMPDEGHASTHMQSAAPDRVSVWTVEGAGHTDGLRTAPAEWASQVVDFLESNLQPL